MNIDDQLHSITTIINSVWPSGGGSASGFFYHQYDTSNNKQSSPGWIKIEEQWLVTNKHVLINTHNELANSITFHYRKITKEGSCEWLPITISGIELYNRCKFHKLDTVDVAIIRVLDLLTSIIPEFHKKGEGIMSHGAVSERMFPGADKISVNVGDEALVIGYPKGYYDMFSKFPIVKSGVIASKWGAPFNGYPYFLIDAKLFPGSSGSLVISRPTNFIIEKGQIYSRPLDQKTFAFLGVFSGEPFTQSRPIETDSFTIISKEGYNVGIVWYYSLIPDIISNGKQHRAQAV